MEEVGGCRSWLNGFAEEGGGFMINEGAGWDVKGVPFVLYFDSRGEKI